MELSRVGLGNPYQIKCLFAGETGVGKTTLIHVITKGEFNEALEPTIGMAFSVKTVELTNPKGEIQAVKAQNWDAAGSMRFRSIVNAYMRHLDLVFLVFDINNRESWDRLTDWRQEIQTVNQGSPLPLFVIVGNKSDRYQNQVTTEELLERCKEWSCKGYLVSCVQLNGPGMINRMYQESILHLHRHIVSLDVLPEHLQNTLKSSFQISMESDAPKCCSLQ